MSQHNFAAITLSIQKEMARDVVGRTQLMPPRVVVEPGLTTSRHINAAVSAATTY